MKADKRLAEIQERTKAATPAPWGRYGIEERAGWESVPGQWIGSAANTEPIARVSGYMLPLRANVGFIIHARQDIPWLLARITELERLVPVSSFLDKVAEALGLSSDGEWREMRKELRATAAAIRNYRDAQPAALRGEEITDAEEEIGTATEIIGD